MDADFRERASPVAELDDDALTKRAVRNHCIAAIQRGQWTDGVQATCNQLKLVLASLHMVATGCREAMVQTVVTIDDLNACSIDTWNCPASAAAGPFAAGICAAIQCDDVPIGTLWLFRNERAEFSIAEAAAADIDEVWTARF